MGNSSAFIAKELTIDSSGGASQVIGIVSGPQATAPNTIQLDDSTISATGSRDVTYGIATLNTAVNLNSVNISVSKK